MTLLPCAWPRSLLSDGAQALAAAQVAACHVGFGSEERRHAERRCTVCDDGEPGRRQRRPQAADQLHFRRRERRALRTCNTSRHCWSSPHA